MIVEGEGKSCNSLITFPFDCQACLHRLKLCGSKQERSSRRKFEALELTKRTSAAATAPFGTHCISALKSTKQHIAFDEHVCNVAGMHWMFGSARQSEAAQHACEIGTYCTRPSKPRQQNLIVGSSRDEIKFAAAQQNRKVPSSPAQ